MHCIALEAGPSQHRTGPWSLYHHIIYYGSDSDYESTPVQIAFFWGCGTWDLDLDLGLGLTIDSPSKTGAVQILTCSRTLIRYKFQ